MIEEQIVKTLMGMGEIGLLLLGCLGAVIYFIKKEQKREDNEKNKDDKQENFQKELIKTIKDDSEKKEKTYLGVIENLRKDSQNRESTLLNTIDKFTEVLAENNKALTELSVQIEHLGKRMADIEHSMDKVNEKLGFEPTV